MHISLIAAIGNDRVIGKDDKLLWSFKEDMRHFREVTMGKPVIMGRKTWDSLPSAFRPLPGRTNIVLSRSEDFVAEGARVAPSVEYAIAMAKDSLVPPDDEIFIIGGAQIYEQALPKATRLYLTEIDDIKSGDAYFPRIVASEWKSVTRKMYHSDPRMPWFAIALYERIK